MNIIKKITAVLCLLCFSCVGIFSVSALDNTQMLTVSFGKDTALVEGSVIRLYRIGTVNGEEIIPEGEFQSLAVDYGYGDTQGLADLALTLEGIVAVNKIQETCRDITDEKGIADFDSATFPEGAYLVLASVVNQDGTAYIPAPSIVFLPYSENGVTPERVALELKYETHPPESEEYTSRKVLKVWQNDREDMRSEKITVQLLCNSSVYDTQVLSEENSWSYTWPLLPADCRWTIVEKDVPTNYTVLVSFEGITFVVTNDAHLPPHDPIDPESTTNEFPPNSPGGPDDEESTHRPDIDEDEDDEELPYTGTNIRFVPYLAIIGTLFFISGYAFFRKGEISDERQ